MDKPLIICSAGHDRRIHKFIDTCKEHVKNADLHITAFTPHFKEANIKINKPYQGHISKYFYFNFPDPERWYIFSDMYDVIFQKDIPELDKFDADILVSSEGMTWEENSFYNDILEQEQFKVLMDKTVFCSGTFAMKGKFFISLIEFYKEKIKNNKGQLNQPLFNLWLQDKNHKNCKELFATLYSNLDNYSLFKTNKGFCWADGVIPAMVHGNGSYDKYL